MAGLDLWSEVDSCRNWYLEGVTEPEDNALRIVIQEGITSANEDLIAIGLEEIKTYPIEVTEFSRVVELSWSSYVCYVVRNESYVTADDDQQALVKGKILRQYSQSVILDFVSKSTFATDDYPGRLMHVEVVCLNHIIDVVSTELPKLRLIGPEQRSSVQ